MLPDACFDSSTVEAIASSLWLVALRSVGDESIAWEAGGDSAADVNELLSPEHATSVALLPSERSPEVGVLRGCFCAEIALESDLIRSIALSDLTGCFGVLVDECAVCSSADAESCPNAAYFVGV